MKTLWAILVVLILLLQVRLWIGEGSFARVWSLENSIAEQRAENAGLAARMTGCMRYGTFVMSRVLWKSGPG